MFGSKSRKIKKLEAMLERQEFLAGDLESKLVVSHKKRTERDELVQQLQVERDLLTKRLEEAEQMLRDSENRVRAQAKDLMSRANPTSVDDI